MESYLYDEFYQVERTHWWFAGMRGIFLDFVEPEFKRWARPRFLDIGCGTGIVLEEFRNRASVCGIDVSERALLYARRRNEETPLLLGSVLDIPLTSECVEIAAALDVIEHVEDDMAGLREIWRVLRPGGAVLINVPAFESLWSEKDDANHHYRRYRRAGLRRVLENSGFRIERISYTNATLFPAIWFARQVGNVVGRPWNSRAEYHPARAVNSTLLGVLHFERALLKRTNLPLGTSITCLARRPS